MIKLIDLFGLIVDLEQIIYGVGIKLVLKTNHNDRALLSVKTEAVANEFNLK